MGANYYGLELLRILNLNSILYSHLHIKQGYIKLQMKYIPKPTIAVLTPHDNF